MLPRLMQCGARRILALQTGDPICQHRQHGIDLLDLQFARVVRRALPGIDQGRAALANLPFNLCHLRASLRQFVGSTL